MDYIVSEPPVLASISASSPSTIPSPPPLSSSSFSCIIHFLLPLVLLITLCHKHKLFRHILEQNVNVVETKNLQDLTLLFI